MKKLFINKSSILMRNITGTLAAALVFAGLYLTSLYSYLLFHSIVELFSILVASGIFLIAWNSRTTIDNNYLLFIGMASIFVAVPNLLHILSYEGMGVFGDHTANISTQLWIMTVYMQSTSLLIAPFFLKRRLRVNLQLAIYGLVTTFLLTSIFYWRIFPVCYVDGVGLTPFKKISEGVVSLLLFAAVILLVRERQQFDSGVWRLIVTSIAIQIGSELAFTSYVSVYGFFNMVGHFLRVAAYYFIYKAIIETGLVKPFAVLFRDLKQSEFRLRQQAAALQTRNQELDAFSHTVAHDLKNPLTALTTISNVILRNPSMPEEELVSFIQDIKTTANQMGEIIDDLMILAEVRKVEAPLKPLDMSAIVANVHRRLRYQIENHQASIKVPSSWPVAIGYGPWIEEVWINYISNALKYGGKPPRVELGASLQPNDMVRFWTRDNGPELSPEAYDRLFVPFTQLKQVNSDGHGLGLSIVRRIIEKLDGQVGVEKLEGQGNLFYFTLPVAPVDESTGTETEAKPKPIQIRQKLKSGYAR
jgi:signal transduction histidine kinase